MEATTPFLLPAFLKYFLACAAALISFVTGYDAAELFNLHDTPSFAYSSYSIDTQKMDMSIISSIYGDLDSDLPSYFNLKDEITLFVEDQGSSDLCDMYANIKSIETNYALKTGNSYNLSEDYLNLLSSNLLYGNREPGTLNDGSTMYFASRYGLPLDVDFRGIPASPVSVPVIKDASCICRVNSTISFTNIDPKRKDYDILMKIFKHHIMRYGSLCIGVTPPYEGDDCFNEKTNAYYFKKTSDDDIFGGHQISIVGFDDNYPAKNFKIKPSRNGAFICLNSWGDGWGDGGYFYISYDNLKDFYMAEGVLDTSDCSDEIHCSYADDHYYDNDTFPATRAENCYAVKYKVPAGADSLDRMILDFTTNPCVIKVYCNPADDSFDKDKYVYLGETQPSVWGISLLTLKEPVKLTGSSFALIFEIDYSDILPDDFICFNRSKKDGKTDIKGHFYKSSGLSGKYSPVECDLILHVFLK